GLAHLKGLKNLKTLQLSGNKLSSKAIDELRQALPMADIQFDPSVQPQSARPVAAGRPGARPVVPPSAKLRAQIEKLGGRVTADEQSSDKPILEISFDGSKVNDKDLAFIKDVDTLKVLELGNTKIGDGGMTHLRRLDNLEKLWLPNTKVTDI